MDQQSLRSLQCNSPNVQLNVCRPERTYSPACFRWRSRARSAQDPLQIKLFTFKPVAPNSRLLASSIVLTRFQQQRASSASPTIPVSPKADYFSGSTPRASLSTTKSPRSPLATPQSPLRPPQLPRSQTSPNLASREQSCGMHKPAEKPTVLKISTDISREERKTQEICVSPSWSDHGEKARKKERRRAEKEQKEREKKLKYDEELQKSADLRAGKRLSKKPPPAAMETQKMPTALRRGSWMSILSSQPSSGENTRRSSREEKRLSGISFGSIKSKRSLSAPATSIESAPATAGASEHWHPIVSPSAPKLPSFRWSSSRKNSNDGHNSASPGSEETYEKDFIAFAYRLESSETVTAPENIDPPKAKHHLTGQAPSVALPGAPTLSRSATEPSFISVPYKSLLNRSPPRTPKARSDSPESMKVVKSTRPPSGKSSPNLVGTVDLPSPGVVPHAQTRPAHDYVHKQRMYQQQQSIAGFEDQQAIKNATELSNELAADHEAVVDHGSSMATEKDQGPGSTTPVEVTQLPNAKKSHRKDSSISSVYTKQRHRSKSPHVASARAKPMPIEHAPLSQSTTLDQPPPEEPHKETAQASLQSPQKSAPSSKPQVSAGFKSDKILGFRRRTKQAPALTSVPYGAENHVEANQNSPLNTQPTEEPVAKRSKIERMFKEPKPPFANRERRTSSSSKSKEALSDTTLTQTHSRTRTSSSTVLNDLTALPLPRSTEPVSNKATNSAVQATPAKDQSSIGSKHAKSEAKTQKSHRPQSSAVAEPEPDVKSIADTKSYVQTTGDLTTSGGDGFENTAIKKQAHEIIVESETGEGLIRKTSIKHPRSNPQLQTKTTATDCLPALDFLPPLKHQPLVKRERQSPTRPAPADSNAVSISQFREPNIPLPYEPPHAPDLKLIPRSPLRPPSQFPVPAGNRFNRSSTDVGTVAFGKGSLADGMGAKPVAKLFVICCKCKFWHDLPSKLYEAMALPLELHKAEKGKVAGARLETAVKCPWCEHAMTTTCCQGWTTVVYLHERHH